MPEQELGLRARKKRATAAALQGAALELFTRIGYVETTVQDITDAAGVSQRTFFRYYPTKDAVLLTEHARREGEVQTLLQTRPGEPMRSLISAIVDHLAADIEERRELVRVQKQVFFAVPALADRFAGHHDRLSAIISAHVARLLGVPEDRDPRPRLVGAQVIRVWTTAIYIWDTGGMVGDLRQIAADALTIARSDPALVDV